MIRRIWSGLRARVIVTYLVIFLLSAAIIVGRSGALFARIAMENAQRDLEVQALTIANALEGNRSFGPGEEDNPVISVAQLQRVVSRFSNASTKLAIYDVLGNPLASSAEHYPGNQIQRPEIASALQGRAKEDVRWDSTQGQRMLFAAAPIQRGLRIYGVVQLMLPASEVQGTVRVFWLSLGLTALLAALVAALAGWLLAGQLVRPVRRVRDAAARLAAGDLEERVPSNGTAGIAEIRQLGEAFNHMAEQVADMIERQRYFVASASHELRTPLTNIKLRAEALGNGALDEPEVAQRFVHDIENEANRMGRMAADLLTLSRQDAAANADAAAAREPVDPAALVADTAEEMGMRAERGGVRLVRDVEGGLPPVLADPNGLRTVMVNLVDNALQYTPAGATITLRACKLDGRLVLQVSDTGAGIAPEDLPHIFERFYRADKSRSRRLAQRGALFGSGAGLGLAIVHSIVDEHGGTVSAESTLGEGTTITVELPYEASAEPVRLGPANQTALVVRPDPALSPALRSDATPGSRGTTQ